MYALNTARLEIHTNLAGWVNVTGKTTTIAITRADGDVGTLSATVADASLDPTTAASLRPGRGVRVSAKNGTGWKVIYTGAIDVLDVDYHPLSRHHVRINLTAADNVARLANITERRGVATLDALRWLAAGQGVAFNINGATTPAAPTTVVATNDNASLWQQILATRDSNLAYAWIDQDNRLQVQDLAHMATPGGPFGSGTFGTGTFGGELTGGVLAATIGPSLYSNVEVDFNSGQIINSVTVNFLRHAPISDTTTEIPYGPYEDADSIAEWGRYAATVTYQGLEEDEPTIAAFAQQILDRNARGEIRANSLTVPITSETLLPLAYIDINQVVEVVLTDNTTVKTLRVIRVEHQVSGGKWLLTLEFDLPGGLAPPSVQPGTGISITPPGSIGEDQLSDAVKAAQAAIAAAAAAALADAADAIEDAAAATTKLDAWTYTGTTKIDGGDIQTDTVTAGQIKADAITAKHTLTGSTVQTGVGTNRVLRMNSAGLVAYDNFGVPILTFSTSTGALTVKGNIESGSTVSGATIIGGLITGADIWSDPDASSYSRARISAGGFQLYKHNGSSVPVDQVASIERQGDGMALVGGGGANTPAFFHLLPNPVPFSLGIARFGAWVEIDTVSGLAPEGRMLGGKGFDSDWKTFTLGSGWSGAAEYRIVGGVVYLRGTVARSSGTGTTMATLPTAARPVATHESGARVGAATSVAAVSTAGAVVISSAYAGGDVFLESITPYPLG